MSRRSINISVYVDDSTVPFQHMIFCHMIADSKAELLSMAMRLNLKTKWILFEGTWQEHFDISISKRRLAVKYGAQEITFHELMQMMKARR